MCSRHIPALVSHLTRRGRAAQARVVPGSLVLDPFCGTASTLLSCAELGASVVGIEVTVHACAHQLWPWARRPHTAHLARQQAHVLCAVPCPARIHIH